MNKKEYSTLSVSTLLQLFTIALFFNSCTVSKNLKSNQTDASWNASFETFNGNEKIIIPQQKNKVAYLSSQIDNTAGSLELLANNTEIPKTNKINHNSFDLTKKLEIKISGKEAKGSFALKYPVFDIKKININYNPNIELLTLSYLLINQDDFSKISDKQTFNINGKDIKVKDLYALNQKIIKEFTPFLKSKNLKIIQSYFDKDFYLHFSNFLLSLNDFPKATVKADNPFLNRFSSIEEAQKLATAFNNLYKEIHFDQFLEKYKPYYKEMIAEVSQSIPKQNFILEMEHFYGKTAQNYNLYPSLTMPFGQGFAVGNANSIGNIFAGFNQPDKIENTTDLSLGFNNNASLRTICIHEFGHSFVNPAIDKVDEKTIKSKEKLFKAIKNKMSDQGYNQWKICLYEHFDRANEVIISKLIGDNKKAEEILKDNVENKSFIYLPQIIKKLEYWYYNEYFTKTYEQKVSEIINELN